MKSKNPLSGKAYFDKDGNLWMHRDLKFGGQLKPKVKPREWFYLVLEACKEREVPNGKIDNFTSSTLGSKVTQWRIRKSLIEKGYL